MSKFKLDDRVICTNLFGDRAHGYVYSIHATGYYCVLSDDAYSLAHESNLRFESPTVELSRALQDAE